MAREVEYLDDNNLINLLSLYDGRWGTDDARIQGIRSHFIDLVLPEYSGFSGKEVNLNHDDVIKWKHFPCYWLFVRGIHRSPVNSPHKGQWRGALMLSLICVWINDWVNNREAGALRRYRAHYDVIVMFADCQLRDIRPRLDNGKHF